MARDFKFKKKKNAIRVSKRDECCNYWVLINTSMTCLGFPLDASGINLTDKILPETDLDLLDTNKHSFSVYVLLVSMMMITGWAT